MATRCEGPARARVAVERRFSRWVIHSHFDCKHAVFPACSPSQCYQVFEHPARPRLVHSTGRPVNPLPNFLISAALSMVELGVGNILSRFREQGSDENSITPEWTVTIGDRSNRYQYGPQFYERPLLTRAVWGHRRGPDAARY
jgi:hypothetical protein